MRKLSKILVMALVVLAVVTMSLNVNAATSKETLTNYIRNAHNVNGMLFELTNSQKNAVTDYIATSLDENTANAVYQDIVSIEQKIKNTGAANTSQISKQVKTEVLEKAKATAKKAGLTLNVNTKTKSFTLVKSDGKTLISGNYTSLVTNPGTNAGSTTAASGKKLLYTGANYALYALPVLAIVAVAVVVKNGKA